MSLLCDPKSLNVLLFMLKNHSIELMQFLVRPDGLHLNTWQQMYPYFTLWSGSLTADQIWLIIFGLCINRFMMKLFKAANIAVVDCCRVNFDLKLASILWSKRAREFDYKFPYVDNNLCKSCLTYLWYSCCVAWLFI